MAEAPSNAWLAHLGNPPVITVGTEESSPAVSIAISSQQDIVAVGHKSGFIKIYDLLSGKELHSHHLHTDSVRCLKFLSSAYNYLLSASDDGTAKFHKMHTRNSFVLTKLSQPILCVDVCDDYLASSSADGTCSVYENPVKLGINDKIITKKLPARVCVMGSHTGPVTSCSFRKDGSRIATGGRDMTVKIWDIAQCVPAGPSPSPLHTIHNAHTDWVTDCKWSNTADLLITASSDCSLKVWDVSKIGNTPGETRQGCTADNVCEEKYTMLGHMAAINHIEYSYGCIVSVCVDGSVKVWSHKGVEITKLYTDAQRATNCDVSVKVEDGSLQDTDDIVKAMGEVRQDNILQCNLQIVVVATCGDDGTARLWYPHQMTKTTRTARTAKVKTSKKSSKKKALKEKTF